MRLLSLDELMGARIVRVVYVAGVLLALLGLGAGVFGGVVGCVTAMHSSTPGAAAAPITATALYLVGGILGLLAWRVLCEALVALFRISEDLRALRASRGSAGQ